MNSLVKKRYLRLVRKAYRFLRSPRLRKHTWFQKILSPMFNRELWHPCRDSVSSGLAIGLFVSMLPVPGQMILAAIGTVRLKGNIPIAIAACWVTNPITQGFIWRFQESFGDVLKSTFNIPMIFGKSEITIIGLGTLNAGSFILGFLTMAILLMVLTYPIVYLMSALVPRLIPKGRYQRARAKIMARKDRLDGQTPSS